MISHNGKVTITDIQTINELKQTSSLETVNRSNMCVCVWWAGVMGGGGGG